MFSKFIKSKSALLLVMFLVAGVTSVNIRNLGEKQVKSPTLDPNCNEYDQTGACCKCSFRYYYNQKTKLCTQVSDYCQTWDEKTGDCCSCYPGNGQPVNGKCNAPVTSTPPVTGQCDPNCQNHDDNRVCIKCYSGYKLDSSYLCVAIVTTPPPTNDNCAKYEYFDVKGKKYAKWFDGCKLVCVECKSGYKLNDKGGCDLIVTTPPPADDHCAEYGYVDAKGKWYTKFVAGCKKVCKKCDEGYQLKDGKCVEIVVEAPEDDHCAVYGYVDAKGKWYTKFVAGCKKVCKKCDQGYELNDKGVCVEVQVELPEDDHCAEYRYVDAKGKEYAKWVHGCKTICKKCESGYYLDKTFSCVALPQYCTAADVYGKCTACVSGYQVNSKGACEKIAVTLPGDNCAEYGYVDAKGKFYSKWTYGCTKVCVKCNSGYYLNAKRVCVSLPKYCTAADVNGKCTACVSGYEVNSKGECVVAVVESPEDDHCVKYGYFDKKGKKYTKWFKDCIQVCVECEDGYEVQDGKCVAVVGSDNPFCREWNEDGECCKCAFRTILGEDGICTPVSDQCSEWDDETGACTCCYAGYKLEKGDCKLDKA